MLNSTDPLPSDIENVKMDEVTARINLMRTVHMHRIHAGRPDLNSSRLVIWKLELWRRLNGMLVCGCTFHRFLRSTSCCIQKRMTVEPQYLHQSPITVVAIACLLTIREGQGAQQGLS